MRTEIEVIPHEGRLYPTFDDYFIDALGFRQVRISAMDNLDYESWSPSTSKIEGLNRENTQIHQFILCFQWEPAENACLTAFQIGVSQEPIAAPASE